MRSFGGGFRKPGSTIDPSQSNDSTSGIWLTGNSMNPWESIVKNLKDNVKTQLSAQNLLNAAGSGVDKFIGDGLGSAAGEIKKFDTSVFDEITDITLSSSTKQNLLRNVNITDSTQSNYRSVSLDPDYGRLHRYENPFQFSSSTISTFNNYKFVFKESVAQEGPAMEVKGKGVVAEQLFMAATPSLFNPNFAVPARQLTPNVPLVHLDNNGNVEYTATLNSDSDGQNNAPKSDEKITIHMYNNGSNETVGANITDCSIKELVRCSKYKSSVLGGATYRYSDFMFCKDLGKVSNNHLITLRKYSTPVGDNIFNKGRGKNDYDGSPASSGKLVAWFGTGENNLEDIMKYDMEVTWKKLTAEIQEIESQEDDAARGPLGKLINTLGGSSYNNYMAAGLAGSHSLLSDLGAMIKIPIIAPNGLQGAPADLSQRQNAMRNYDKNKVYEPKDRIWDTHTYEGRLIFSHEFTLKFSYTLRSYDNINPKSAMLDLLANILHVTYKDGKFWGGSVKMIGAPRNQGAWNKANAFIDKAWDKVGGFIDALFNGNIDFGKIMGSIANAVQGMANAAKETAQKIANGGAGELIQKAYGNVKSFIKSRNIDGALKGMLKNTLGRPAVYTMSSLLSGEDVGLWHVTIGNPKNPIAAFGNLILTKASVQHSGPLGIDDFPTHITVTCTLKHARSRDAAAISRMYTKGAGQIYMGLAAKKMSKYFKDGKTAEGEKSMSAQEEELANARAAAEKQELAEMQDYNEKAKKAASQKSSEEFKDPEPKQSDYKKNGEDDTDTYNKKHKEWEDKKKAFEDNKKKNEEAAKAAEEAAAKEAENNYKNAQEANAAAGAAQYDADLAELAKTPIDYTNDNGMYDEEGFSGVFYSDNVSKVGNALDSSTT